MKDRRISRTDRRVRWIVVGFVALVLALGSAGPVRANLILDPGFEDATFGPNWTLAPTVGSNITLVTASPPPLAHAGTQFASFAPIPTGTLSQSFTTVAGQDYKLAFWARGNSASNGFTAQFGTTTHSVSLVLDGNYHLFEFVDTASVTGTTTLTFQAAGTAGSVRLDDVDVNPVPEPASLSLLGLGLVGLIGYQWRRRQRAITR